MAKAYAKQFYNSKAWKITRSSYIALRKSIDGGLCEHCKERQGYIVDHKVEITPANIDNSSITLNYENLQYLCLCCHNTKTFYKNRPLRTGLFFDTSGDLLERTPPCES